MLLFIPKKSGHEHSVRTVSIHLMLLFIVTSLRKSYSFESFQYISCYSLSKFNHKDLAALVTFQYISCYSLSDADIGNYVYGKMFQYISCYSLSGISTSLHAVNACFNTSHVTLYLRDLLDNKQIVMFQYISCYSLSLSGLCNTRIYIRFNTSHVTLYLKMESR